MKFLLSATALAGLTALAPQLVAANTTDREITVVAQNVPALLDPARDHANSGQQYYHNAFDTLILKDPTSAEARWIPGLATEWKMIDDLTMELKLRQGVIFHNGATMTADDVLYSLNRMFSPTFPPYVTRAKDRFTNFSHAEKVDEQTIRIVAKRPDPLFETLVNLQQLAIIPRDYVAGLTGDPKVVEDTDHEAFALAPVGTGPYRISEFKPSQGLTYTRHDAFWGEPAPLAKVNVIRVPEVSARLTALRTGEAHIATNIPPDQLADVTSNGTLKAVGEASALFHVVIFNVNHPKLQDPRIRQALMLSIDRDLINEAFWLGKSVVPASHTMSEYGEMYQPELSHYSYDPERAKSLLEEAGYDGFEVVFHTQGNYYTNGLLTAQAIAEMWRAIGINAVVRDVSAMSGSDPEIMIRNWSNMMFFNDPYGNHGMLWAPGGNAESLGRYNVPKEDYPLWDAFRFGQTPEERKAAYAKILDRNTIDPAHISLLRPYESWAMTQEVNWAPMPGNIPYILDFRAGSISFND